MNEKETWELYGVRSWTFCTSTAERARDQQTRTGPWIMTNQMTGTCLNQWSNSAGKIDKTYVLPAVLCLDAVSASHLVLLICFLPVYGIVSLHDRRT